MSSLRDFLFHAELGIELYCGDNRIILPLLAPESVDLIVTDPPYGLSFNNGDLAHQREKALGRGEAGEARPIAGDNPLEWESLMRGFLLESRRLLRNGSCCCCCGGGGPKPIFARLTLWMDEYLKFKQAIVWDKGGLGMGWHYRRNYEFMLVAQHGDGACKWYANGRDIPNVLRLPKIIPSADEHPTAKPQELMGWFIDLHSEGQDVVLDPFMGHGPTLEAAKARGRHAIGIEIEPKYCEIAVKRLRQEVLPLV